MNVNRRREALNGSLKKKQLYFARTVSYFLLCVCLCVSDLTTSCLHRSCCSAAAQPRLNPTKRQYCRVDDFIRNNKRKHTRHTRLQQCCTNHTTRVCFSHCHKFQISENISSCLQKNLHPYSIYKFNKGLLKFASHTVVEVLAAKAKQSWWMDCVCFTDAIVQTLSS